MFATPTLDKLHALKLPAMAQAWTEQQHNAELAAPEPAPQLTLAPAHEHLRGRSYYQEGSSGC